MQNGLALVSVLMLLMGRVGAADRPHHAIEIDRERRHLPLAHGANTQERQFLGAANGKGRDEHGALAVEDAGQPLQQALLFRLARRVQRLP